MLQNKRVLYVGSRALLLVALLALLAVGFTNLLRDFYRACNVSAYNVALTCTLSAIYTFFLYCYTQELLIEPIRNLVMTSSILKRMSDSKQIDISIKSLSSKELRKYNTYMYWIDKSPDELNNGVKCVLRNGVFRFYI